MIHNIEKENKYYDLLMQNPRFKPQGTDRKFQNVVVGIIRGNIDEYKECDFLDFEHFKSWEEAYTQLFKKYKDK